MSACSSKPRHNKFRSVGTGSDHDSFYAIDANSYKAFYNFESVGTGSTHDAFEGEGYEAVLILPVQNVDIDESLSLSDEVAVSLVLTIDDPMSLSAEEVSPANFAEIEDAQDLGDDLDFVLTVLVPEEQSLSDEMLNTITEDYDEPLSLGDSAEPAEAILADETQSLTDDLFTHLTLSVNENNSLGDSTDVTVQPDIAETQSLADDVYYRLDYAVESSLEVRIVNNLNVESSLEVQVAVYDAPPVTSLTSPSNPFQPAVAVGGVTYAGTIPIGASNFLSFDRSAGFGLPSCDDRVLSFNVNLNFSGGTFEYTSLQSSTVIGQTVTILGLTGTVTESGRGADGKNYFITRGIFGSREMDRELLLTASAVNLISGLVHSDSVGSPSAQTWTTIASAAKAIAAHAGVTLDWQASNGILTDMFGESGTTVREAIVSLASRVGAILIWRGNDRYIVTEPGGIGGGGWSGPADCLFINKIEQWQILDTKRDFVVIPVNTTTIGSGQFKLPDAFRPPAKEIVEPLYQTRHKIDSENPAAHIILPPDFDGSQASNGRIQIYTNAGAPADPFVTQNPNTWFPAGLPVVYEKETGQYSLVVSSLPFPPNISNNEFDMRIGYVRKTSGLIAGSQQAFNDRLERKKALINIEQQKARIIKINGGLASMRFTGHMPMPGNNVNFQRGLTTLEGTVESVSISGAANSFTTMSITTGEFKKIEVLTARQVVDRNWATGGGSLPTP